MKIPKLGSDIPTFGNSLSRKIGYMILRSMRWRIEGEIPNLKKMVIIGAPHTTNWDFVIGMSALMALGVRVHWIGKDTIFKWPVKYVWHWLGGEPVDRFHAHGVVEQIIQKFSAHDQFILGLSPEGTRRDIPKWRSGFYHVSVGAGVPILLVAFDFPSKTLRIGELFYPTSNPDSDMLQLTGYFKNFRGKFVKTWQK